MILQPEENVSDDIANNIAAKPNHLTLRNMDLPPSLCAFHAKGL
jgi:hypothetical protein